MTMLGHLSSHEGIRFERCGGTRGSHIPTAHQPKLLRVSNSLCLFSLSLSKRQGCLRLIPNGFLKTRFTKYGHHCGNNRCGSREDERLSTLLAYILLCGIVLEDPELTHPASHQSRRTKMRFPMATILSTGIRETKKLELRKWAVSLSCGLLVWVVTTDLVCYSCQKEEEEEETKEEEQACCIHTVKPSQSSPRSVIPQWQLSGRRRV